MITLINGTNRPDNRTSVISETYQQFLITRQTPFQYLNLEHVDGLWFIQKSLGKAVPEFDKLVEKYFNEADKLIIVMPEYNGSFPGILKLLIDVLPYKILEGKKIALTGVASGRGGNLRGLDHLTGILHYLNAYVHPFKLPVSGVLNMIQDNHIKDENTLRDIQKQLEVFLKF